MKNTAISRLKGIARSFLLVPLFIALVFAQIVLADTTETTFNQTINAGTLSVDIVDGSGDTVASPSVSFSGVTFSFDAQTATGTLGTASEKIRLSNPTSTAAWNMSIAATGGQSAVWTTGSYTYPYNNATADNGRLTVDPSVATVTPLGSCNSTGVTKGSSAYFNGASVTSIDLLTASGSAQIGCRWDLTGVSLSQRIPASQVAGSYSLAMTITAL